MSVCLSSHLARCEGAKDSVIALFVVGYVLASCCLGGLFFCCIKKKERLFWIVSFVTGVCVCTALIVSLIVNAVVKDCLKDWEKGCTALGIVVGSAMLANFCILFFKYGPGCHCKTDPALEDSNKTQELKATLKEPADRKSQPQRTLPPLRGQQPYTDTHADPPPPLQTEKHEVTTEQSKARRKHKQNGDSKPTEKLAETGNHNGGNHDDTRSNGNDKKGDTNSNDKKGDTNGNDKKGDTNGVDTQNEQTVRPLPSPRHSKSKQRPLPTPGNEEGGNLHVSTSLSNSSGLPLHSHNSGLGGGGDSRVGRPISIEIPSGGRR